MTEKRKAPLRVGLISLGCAKNLVDAEIILGSLLRDGVEITNDAAQADAVIVNTCSFIDAAQEESVDAILESTAVRDADHRGQAIIVSGCMPQRFREELPKLMPEDGAQSTSAVVVSTEPEALTRATTRGQGVVATVLPTAQPRQPSVRKPPSAERCASPGYGSVPEWYSVQGRCAPFVTVGSGIVRCTPV